MPPLDSSSIQALLDRFGQFADAVLVEVRLLLPRTAAERSAIVRLLSQDLRPNQGAQWRIVSFEVQRLAEFKFAEGRVSNLVLSDGLRIHFLQRGCFIDLAPHSDQPQDEEGLRRSHQYVMGAACSYEIDDYIGQ